MTIIPSQQQLDAASAVAAEIDADIFVFNSELYGPKDFEFINIIADNRSRPNALLVLVTNGGDPDVAYRISRYFQESYESFTVLVAGRCKSAGTLIAIGASALAFMPYGELGPLDIQLSKVDKFDGAQSGLAIQDALNTLESRATESFFELVKGYMDANQGMLSFAAATKASSEFVTQLYAPVFAKIDPEEVGARTRSMRIADDYGQRLSAKWQNPRNGAVKMLSESYSSHSFVIDQREAETLFHNVRAVTEKEKELVATLGAFARFQLPRGQQLLTVLHDPAGEKEQPNANNDDGGEPQDGGDSSATVGEAEPAPEAKGRSGLRAIQAKS
jgi:hypothetical protein